MSLFFFCRILTFMLPRELPVIPVAEFLDSVNIILKEIPASIFGEVTSISRHPTGVYFSLQDEAKTALLQCYLPPATARYSGSVLEEGMQVKITGTASLYKPKGRFSFFVETIEPYGEGALKKAYEVLKKQLASEGLFERKRILPPLIKRIALVTSKTGAAIGDFKKNLHPRGISVDVYGVLVEGVRAEADIISALSRIARHASSYDVIILIRGGGSVEDLNIFNSEQLARTIFTLPVPTICAIGHEKDVPIAQLVADYAVSTPTATAILINSFYEQLELAITESWTTIQTEHSRIIDRFYSSITDMIQESSRFFLRYRHRLEYAISGLFLGYQQAIGDVHTRITHATQLLQVVDPKRILSLGYSITKNAMGRIIRHKKEVAIGDHLQTLLDDGVVDSIVQ